MSTAGKVLVVLIALVAVVWIVLTAGVAQLNRNGAKAVEDLQGQVAKLQKELQDTEEGLQKTKDDWSFDQYVTQRRLTELAAKQTDIEKLWSESKESLARVKLQLADAEASSKLAQEDKARMVADHQAETKALKQARADVETLKSERKDRVDRLTELRQKLKATLDENRSLVEKIQKKSGSPTSRANARRVRPVSIAH